MLKSTVARLSVLPYTSKTLLHRIFMHCDAEKRIQRGARNLCDNPHNTKRGANHCDNSHNSKQGAALTLRKAFRSIILIQGEEPREAREIAPQKAAPKVPVQKLAALTSVPMPKDISTKTSHQAQNNR
jgi:hypothetical protein